MFELPLPPLNNATGAAQRTLANKYGVKLIPKHYLTAIFRLKGGTTDGIHMSEKGHWALANMIGALIRKD
jgi:acyl-CoA thioesterase I